MVLSHTSEVNQAFKERMVWWNAKRNNIKLKIWQDPWFDFMLCWMMFDAYLTEISQSGTDSAKLRYFYETKCDFKDIILGKWDSLSGYRLNLKSLSPIYDMRPNSNNIIYIEDENDLKQIFDFLYQIRCNLFHGAKNIKNDRDAELVRHGAKFLRISIDFWMKGG